MRGKGQNVGAHGAPPQAVPPVGYALRDIQLEMSLKPFWDATPATREAVCRELFCQWFPLCRFAETVSVMLWIGDGSEILEYAGDGDVTFEWGRYHGCANVSGTHRPADAVDDLNPDHAAIGATTILRDPERRGVHLRSYLYRSEPATFSYRWLGGLVETLKRVGREVTGKPILVGMTFDIGPEFAVSRFKYQWHPEICGGGSLFGGSFIRCDIPLKGDTRAYAGFPNGIPNGTSFGTFLGRQSQRLADDCGFDFLWLSNGFGFAAEPWALTGAIFDGVRFATAQADKASAAVLQFWKNFREEAPGLRIRTRGTNMGTGIDLGSEASPIREIYSGIPHVEPPVNSPWAALDGDIGLELAGWMAHIARTPGNGFRFRYYTHDPWWLNSPWLDRYQRQPFDIYLPLSVSRILPEGGVEPPSDLAFLSVDDSHGCLPPQVPPEVIAHILPAREFVPDAPAPLVWVYPFDAYHECLGGSTPRPDLPFFGDWFARGLIAHGVPLNTVADERDARVLVESGAGLEGSILVAPALRSLRVLLDHALRGGRVLFFGPLDDLPELREVFGLEMGEAWEGDFLAHWDGAKGRSLRHMAVLSAGGWRETGGESPWVASRDGETRVAACFRELPGGGALGWVRGSLATAEFDPTNPRPLKGPRLRELPGDTFAFSEDVAREVLARLGVVVDFPETGGERPLLTIHRHENAFVFSGYQSGAVTPLGIRLALGAPVFPGRVNRIENACTILDGTPWWHHVCRAFVDQQQSGNIQGRILPAIQHGTQERLLLSGLENTSVTFFPKPGTEGGLEILRAPLFPYFHGDFAKPPLRQTHQGLCVTVENATGELLFSW